MLAGFSSNIIALAYGEHAAQAMNIKRGVRETAYRKFDPDN